jgi:hypothetical protein
VDAAKRAVRDEIALALRAGPGAIAEAKGRRRVGVAVTVAGCGRLLDPDNMLKALFDGLVANRMLVDDSARWCQIGDVSVARGKAKRTVITLEDI